MSDSTVVVKGTKELLREKVIAGLDLTKNLSDEQIGEYLDRCILNENAETYLPLKEKIILRKEIFNSIRRFDVLTDFLDDDQISEIMVNGTNNIFYEKRGRIIKSDKHFESPERLMAVVRQIVSDCNRRINEAQPIVDARLKDGSRVNVVLSPVSLDGTAVTIRKFPTHSIDMDKLIDLKSMDRQMAEVLKCLVKAKYNIFISGGTGSGKTTFLNALSDYIPKSERVITIEDSAELRLIGLENYIRLEARTANVEGENEITIRDLIKTSLRMRPSTLIVGEVRGGEAIDMLAAMNTGHSSLSTGHANSAYDMLSRLETMVLMGIDMPISAIRMQIKSAIDIIIHLGRFRDGSRKVISINEIDGIEDGQIKLNTLFEFADEDNDNDLVTGRFRKVNCLHNTDKLKRSGQLNRYMEVFNNDEDEVDETSSL